MVALSTYNASDEKRRLETAALVEQLRTTQDPDEQQRLRQQIIVVNVPVATSIAMRYRSRGESLEDLVQTAQLGLVKAVNGFDAGRGLDFLAYAVPTISGEVKRHFRDQTWDIRPPRRIQELRTDVERASAQLTQALGRPPRLSEIAEHLGAREDDVVECVASAELYHVNSLDAPVGGADELPVSETVGAVDPTIDQIDDVLSVRPLMDRLTARERKILSLRFYSDWTQQQIADEVGVTQMQISRVLGSTLKRLRDGLTAA
jgi:RNA polymerase sigma-B factor